MCWVYLIVSLLKAFISRLFMNIVRSDERYWFFFSEKKDNVLICSTLLINFPPDISVCTFLCISTCEQCRTQANYLFYAAETEQGTLKKREKWQNTDFLLLSQPCFFSNLMYTSMQECDRHSRLSNRGHVSFSSNKEGAKLNLIYDFLWSLCTVSHNSGHKLCRKTELKQLGEWGIVGLF